MPYQESSSCNYNNLGKCLSIEDAYIEATTGDDQSGKLVNGEEPNKKFKKQNKIVSINDSRANYQDSVYKKMQKMVNAKEMPLLKPATTRRVLVLSYKSKDSTIWYEPRYIYYIEQELYWMLNSALANRKNINTLNL